MNQKHERLTLDDLELELDTERDVKGGTGFSLSIDSSPSVADIDLELPGISIPDGSFQFGPRPDCGAGDALAWNEGDIALAEVE